MGEAKAVAHKLICGGSGALYSVIHVYTDGTVEVVRRVEAEGAAYGHALVGLSNGTAVCHPGEGEDMFVVHPDKGVVGTLSGANDSYSYSAVELPDLHVAVSRQGGVRIHSVVGECGKVLEITSTGDNINALAVLPDGRLAVGHSTGITLYSLDLIRGVHEEVGFIQVDDPVFNMIWVPGRPNQLITVAWCNEPFAVDLETLTQLPGKLCPGESLSIASVCSVPELGPAAFFAVRMGGRLNMVFVEEGEGATVVPVRGLDMKPATYAILPGGRLVCVARQGSLRLITLPRQGDHEPPQVAEFPAFEPEPALDAKGSGLVLVGPHAMPPGLVLAQRTVGWHRRRAVVMARRALRAG